MGPLTNITHYIPHITQLGLSHKYLSYHYQNWATKLYHLYKKPKLIYLVGKIQKAQQNSLTNPVATWHPKAYCYMALLQTRCYTALLLSPLLHGNIFTKSQTSYKKPKYYFGNYLQKAQILFWQFFTKAQYYFSNYLQKPNIILATTYKSPILSCNYLQKPKYYLAK